MLGRSKSLVIAALAAGSLAGLGGCAGFTPLYANQGVTGGMHAIALETPQTRTGYLLRQDLEDELGIGKDVPPRYRLSVTLIEHRRPRGLNPDDTPTRYELRLDATYVLTDVGGKVLFQRTRPVFVSTDSVVQPYASIASQTDGEERIARAAAQMIRTDVALALKGQ